MATHKSLEAGASQTEQAKSIDLALLLLDWAYWTWMCLPLRVKWRSCDPNVDICMSSSVTYSKVAMSRICQENRPCHSNYVLAYLRFYC